MPRTFYAAGLNYADHVIAAANKRGELPNLPEAADVGYRAVNSITGHEDPIIVPADATEQLQYEGEIVVVIGEGSEESDRRNRLGLHPWLHHRQ